MKKTFPFVFLLLFLLARPSLGQELDLHAWQQRSQRIQRQAMGTLGSWAAGNLLYSGIQYGRTRGETRYFHEMNLGWGGVNLILAGAGWLSRPAPWTSPAQGWRHQRRMEQILLFNTALDLAYMAGGAWMLERAKHDTESSDRWRGYGQSVLLQGLFLATFDLVFYVLHQRQGNRILAQWQAGPGGVSFITTF